MKINWPRLNEKGIRNNASRALSLLILSVFLLQASGFLEIPLLSRLEAMAYDMRLRLTMPNTVSPDVIIIDIDEKSLAKEGRWPWGRDKMAALMDNLFDRYQIAAVGFDVVFAEPDENSGLKVLQELKDRQLKNVPQYGEVLEKIRPQLDHDNSFANTLKGRPIVLGYYFNTGAGETRTSGSLPAPVFRKKDFEGVQTDFLVAEGYGANLKIFQDATLGGHFNPIPDFDGVSRRTPMLIKYGDGYYESLSLALARAVLGVDAITPIAPKNGGYASLEELDIGGLKIPLDKNACALIPYRGKQGSFKYISATDILHGNVNPKEVSGKIALVGTSAPGLMDLRSTPVGSVYPGVEIHANLLAGILEQNFKQRPVYSQVIEMLTLLLTGLLLSWLLPKMGPIKSFFVAFVALLAVIAGNLAAWQYSNMILAVTPPLILVLSIFSFNLLFGFIFETRAKKQISGLFGQYIPPELVDEMSKDPAMFSMKGESRDMTVLFSDIRDFTKMSEKLSPEELSNLINEYLTPMTKVIHKHHGTVDKYIGDAIMCFWGAPIKDPAHAQQGVLAALEMQEVLDHLNDEFKKKNWPELKIGIGLNSGMMSVGNMGSEFRKAYTVMGDAVNLGSRLESLTKQYGVGIFVSESTKNAVSGVIFQEIDRVRVKGKHEPVTIYRPFGPEGQVAQSILDEAAQFAEALELYRAKEWDKAEAILTEMRDRHPPGTLYSLYLERIEAFRENPPPEIWDGVFEMKSK